jgi:hypothetical protein
MRYNGGGYLDIASEIAFMIAGPGPGPGPGPTSGEVFEQQIYNDRNPFQLTAAQAITPFHAVAQGFSLTSGSDLATLNLVRVYALVGAGTCSANEAVVNGLRGVGVTVDLIGATTCGKPYGFYPQDNCGTTNFSIQFSGVDQLGQGNYADGFTPTCAAVDDFTHALGDPNENRLAAALGLRSSGVCSPPMGMALARGLALFTVVPLSAAMLWKSHADPARYAPVVETVHFLFAATALTAVSVRAAGSHSGAPERAQGRAEDGARTHRGAGAAQRANRPVQPPPYHGATRPQTRALRAHGPVILRRAARHRSLQARQRRVRPRRGGRGAARVCRYRTGNGRGWARSCSTARC